MDKKVIPIEHLAYFNAIMKLKNAVESFNLHNIDDTDKKLDDSDNSLERYKRISNQD